MNTTIDCGTTEVCPITQFIISLGKQLLQQKVRDWLDLDAAADFCRTHGLRLNGECPSSSTLETTLRQFFKGKDEFYGSSVNVDGYERPNLWERPFMMRAYPFAAPSNSVSLRPTITDEAESEVQNPDIAKVGYTVSILPPPIPISNDALSIP